jgi:hypothetical protein
VRVIDGYTRPHADERGLALYDLRDERLIDLFGPLLPPLSDAIAWDDDHVLLATQVDICLLDIARSNCPRFPGAPRAGAVNVIARDAAGRFWLGGRGLWALDEQNRFVRFDTAAPFLAGAEVHSITSDRQRVAFSLGERGVAIVETSHISLEGRCPRRK